MKFFMSNDYLLENDTAKQLYEKAGSLPIYDFHSHLSSQEIYNDRKFNDLSEMWLEADHYKWRIMRASGIEEKYITGDANAYEKFYNFAKILPLFMGNPLYHWAHMELKKYFNISLPICEENALTIWEETKAMMGQGQYTARELIAKSNVHTVITTDDPIDNLRHHKLLQKENLPFEVLPCFRPDKAINILNDDFIMYLDKLSFASNIKINNYESLVDALENRLQFFIKTGATAADLSFANFPIGNGDVQIANVILQKRLTKETITLKEAEVFMFSIIASIAQLLKKHNIVMQIHTGVMRNCNTKLYYTVGVDSGGDAIGSALNIENARNLFDYINSNGGLPKTIVYTLNPNSYYPLAILLGSFQGASKGHLQLGAAWWFLDHKDGIKEQLKVCAATGGLGLFVGMLTDSRSFTSFARHDYFRRILCSLVGKWVERGEYPRDINMLNSMLENICFNNAKEFFSMQS